MASQSSGVASQNGAATTWLKGSPIKTRKSQALRSAERGGGAIVEKLKRKGNYKSRASAGA